MKRKTIYRAFTQLFLFLICLLLTAPFLWMILGSLKTNSEVMNPATILPQVPQWNNYTEILFNSPIPRYLGNSLFVAIAVVILQVFCSTLFSYGITFLRFPGRKWLYRIVLFSYMVPTAATYIPGYIMLADLGLLNTYAGLILSNGVSVFGIFLLRHAFLQLPAETLEAAKMDGAGHLTILLHLAVPMTKQTFSTMIVLAFIGNYNSYMWPSLITDSPELSLVSQGLRRFLYEGGAYGTQWSLVMAASSLVIIPILILLFTARRHILTGILDGK